MIVYFNIISGDIIYNQGEWKDFADERSRNEFGGERWGKNGTKQQGGK